MKFTANRRSAQKNGFPSTILVFYGESDSVKNSYTIDKYKLFILQTFLFYFRILGRPFSLPISEQHADTLQCEVQSALHNKRTLRAK